MNNLILISKNEIGEIKVAFIKNNNLYNFEIESENSKCQKGNIFKGFVTKIEGSLDAFFIDYGSKKDGFLSFTELSKDYLDSLNIFDSLEKIKDYTYILGKSFIVQIEKEECDGKGASLTTYLNFAGCYLVLMPFSSELKGISKKITEIKRFELKELLKNIKFIKEMGIIIRTFGHGKNIQEFKIELLTLLSQLKLIKNLNINEYASNFIYEHNNLIIRTIKDHLKFNIDKIIIDDIILFNSIHKYLSIMQSSLINKLTLHTDKVTLFNKYNNIDQQIEMLFKREIFLPSGGSITIDCVEALIFIDINSSKSNKCDDVEETSLQTNLEALNEITRQLRLRDLGGLIIIDFIDVNIDNFILIEKKFKDLLKSDKAKINIEKISKFGLLELSREKIKSIFGDLSFSICNKCNGTGKIENIETIVLNIIKSIENEIIKKNIYQINVEMPIKLSNYLINLKIDSLNQLEKTNNTKIILIINNYLSSTDYKIYTFKQKEKNFLKKFLKRKKKQHQKDIDMPGSYLLSLKNYHRRYIV